MRGNNAETNVRFAVNFKAVSVLLTMLKSLIADFPNVTKNKATKAETDFEVIS